MCQIAPFQMKCELEKGNCLACAVHKLSCATTELKQKIPFFGTSVPDYHCPDFEPDPERQIDIDNLSHAFHVLNDAGVTAEQAMENLIKAFERKEDSGCD